MLGGTGNRRGQSERAQYTAAQWARAIREVIGENLQFNGEVHISNGRSDGNFDDRRSKIQDCVDIGRHQHVDHALRGRPRNGHDTDGG